MGIRLLENNDQCKVVAIMAGHPFQFPKFIRAKYPERWREFLIQQDEKACGYYVAYEGTDEILGHAGYIFHEEVGLYEIVGVAVHKGHQRKGIGKALINTICSKVRDFGMERVILYTLGHVENEATLTFYHNIGFDKVNFEQDFFITDYHRVTFEKVIP